MFSTKVATFLTIACGFSSALAFPIHRREVPQEHSHEQFLTNVRTNLNLNNPDKIQDPVFALLGNAAASQGKGNIADPDCLQQATADRAFTNAKAAKNIQGMVSALIYRGLERNTGSVGLASVACTSLKAVNPEIAAITQHQDPASNNAAAINKAITLELARQIAAVGGNPQDALKAGTFAPGNRNDATGKGNTCDDLDDPQGCIFTKNLLVPDATAAEITAAVAGNGNGGNNNNDNDSADDDVCPPTVTEVVTVTVDPPAATATAAPANNNGGNNNNNNGGSNNNNNAGNNASGNVQKFSGALGGQAAPAVTRGGRGFNVAGSDSFINQADALGRSCDIQKNKCADFANSSAGRATGLKVSQCDQQNSQCRARI